MFEHIQAVLFDLDGTLIDSAADLGRAADRMRTQRGLSSLPLEHYRPLAGMGARGMLQLAFDITPEAPEFEALRTEYLNNYEVCMAESTQPFEGVLELIQALEQRQMPWGIVTNKFTRFARPLVSSLPTLASSRVLVCGDTTEHPKPHPAPLLHAARAIGLAPEVCLYVGDDERDIVAGRAAGMPTVAANYGYLGLKSDSSTWGADASIERPLDLVALLRPASH